MDRAVRVQTAAMSPWQTERRVIVFNAGFGSFRGCGRTESSAIVDDRTDLVVDRGNTPAPVPPLDVTDAPVCTHGCRDRFCRLAETRPLDGGRSGSPHPRVLRAPAVTGSPPQRPSPLPRVEFGAHLDGRPGTAGVGRSNASGPEGRVKAPGVHTLGTGGTGGSPSATGGAWLGGGA